MQMKVTILSKKEIFEKYPKEITTKAAILARAATESEGIDIACVEGLKGSQTIIFDLQTALNNYVGEGYMADIYYITDMFELEEKDKIYCAFETKEGGSY